MHKILCEKCGVGLHSDLKLKDWVCSPCLAGISPKSIHCIACTLSDGVFISTEDHSWLHLFCALLLNPYAKSITQIKLSRNALNCTVATNFPEALFAKPCMICRSHSKSAVISCQTCEETFHISCVINKLWKMKGEKFECGCKEKRKTVKRVKNLELPPIRGPRSCLVLEHILERVIKADYLMLFREVSVDSLSVNNESLLKNLTSSCYIDATSEYLSVVITNTQTSLKKKQKIETSSNLFTFAQLTDVIDQNEPKFIENYSEYESKKLLSLDHIYRYYVRGHSYFSMSQVIHDIRLMILSKLASVASVQEKIYINQFWDIAIAHLKHCKKQFEEAVVSDWNDAIENNQSAAKVKSNWHKEPFESRDYEMINDYLEVSEGTKNRLGTKKKGKCNASGCLDLTELGPFELINSTWGSVNSDRKNRVECSDECECDKSTCKNRQISLKQFQMLNDDVKETATWGFDMYTYRNILAYVRHPVTAKTYKFISKAMSRAINSVQENNWDIRNALTYILNDQQQIFKLREKRYASGILNAIKGISEIIGINPVLNEFRIHPKGTGVICCNPNGISKNSLIVEYFGQLYSPAKWYEKQDLVKSVTNQIKKKEGVQETLPDFYNIMLERHMDDPDGYDVLIVDPIFYGNYGSRLSHSCTPNCGTVTMVAEGKYSIGMYALADINYLDELTFDYNSITESKEEHLNAVCLCASSVCRSYYLAHAQNSSNIPAFHNFLHRVSLILKASVATILPKHLEICEKFCIRNAVLDSSPDWLKIWIALVLEVVEKEVDGIEIEIYKKMTIESRLQHLVMTVDKVKYCMEHSNSHAPYRLLTYKEVIEYLWGNNDTSVRQQLKKLLAELGLPISLTAADCLTHEEIRLQLLRIRDLLRSIPRTWKGAGIGDIVHLIAYTQIFFYEIGYNSFDSDSVMIRLCEVKKSNNVTKVFKSLAKKYSAMHIQGTLCGWYKQTVEKPAASLSADKRGTLTLSCIENPADLEYSGKFRTILLGHLKEKPSSAWPTKANMKYPWGNFTNKAKVLGTPMFDSVYLPDSNSLEKTLQCIDVPAEQCELVSTFCQD